MSEPTFGLVLAGGLSRRMGGGDKPLRRVGGRAILEWVTNRLGPQCEGLLINANGDPGRFASFGLPVVVDDIPDFAGPLAGVLAGLDWVAYHAPAIRWVVSVAGDTPFIPPDLVARLHAGRPEADTKLACASSGGRTHPVIALWPVSVRGDLRAFLTEEGQRKVGAFGARHGIAEVVWPVEPYDPFFNANAPDDLTEAEAIARRIAEPGP